MISIGCTSWGDHFSLYKNVSAKDKLKVYSEHFPIVEVDASFYAVQPIKNYEKWVAETPETFGFTVKAYQGMTGHSQGEDPHFSNEKEMFEAFKESIQPLLTAGKLRAVLCQFPPWFKCERPNVERLKRCREMLGDLPCALEFRHQSWFQQDFRDRTLAFMKEQQWIHTVCDEPQAGEGSVPIVPEATHPERTLVRMHGRNKEGWVYKGENRKAVRCLYRYSEEELQEWGKRLQFLARQSEHVDVVFNNNSGGDAADNARRMIKILEIDYDGLAPSQLGFF
ncbi:MAG TPA: DUF72 domain-containing protein [Bacillales bacterium]|nr:DUF72 domain-containing protein [Bacillales bacterium]